MVNLKEELWNTLEKLKERHFKHFKWFLEQDGILEGFKGIPASRLEKAERQDTVDLMVQQYQDHGALKVTMKILKKINRNDLVQRLQKFNSQPEDLKTHHFSFPEDSDDDSDSDSDSDDDSDDDARLISQINRSLNLETHDFRDQREYEIKKAELQSVQQFAVEVTLDPDTAHPNLILSEDGKQVHHGDVRQKLPDNPERFYRCVNVLGKQSFSSGRFYYEVQVKGKRAWNFGVAKESIGRKGGITLSPEDGFWTIWRKGKIYKAIDDPSVSLSLKSEPEKVGVFVDCHEGLIRFYDVDTADRLYSFTDCSFTEKLLPFFSPCTNDSGRNSVPLRISPINHLLNLKTHDLGDQREYERKKAELKSVQQFAVEITLDPDTAHPNLILSKDGKQVHHGDVRQKLPDNPERFDRCVNVLGKQSFSSGRFYYEVQVKGKSAWTLGVAKESIDRKGSITVSPKNGFWTIWLRKGNKYVANDNPSVHLTLKSHPEKVGVFVDYDEGLVCFYDVDTADRLYSFTGCSFTEKLLPYLSPCTNDGGTNSAPLIISPVNHLLNVKTHDFSDQREYERKKAELKRIQQFAVEVTLDPDTAHPNLILSEDGKQVHHGDVRQKLPDNPERFYRCVNVLGKQSFSSGRFYYEVQVKGKSTWTLGVAKESIDRKGSITVSPKNGFWTIWLRKGNKYVANDNLSVHLTLKSHPEKVGVFVDYDEGLIRFYDVDTADRLYSFTGCSFTEKLLPYLSPCTNDGGTNSAPLIISPVNHLLNVKTHDLSDQTEYERKKAELKRIQQFAVEVTLDPDTAHPNLILSEDGKQVHHGDVRQKLPDNPERFYRCVNVLGKQSFSSGRFYYEAQVKGKRAWALGVAKESIKRKGDITANPENGYWTIMLRHCHVYEANDNDPVHLQLKSQPEKVGLFVDYDEGLVRFYDVDTADCLYSFTGCSFTEKLLPFFTPCTNNGGTNSAPLIISPFNHPLNVKTHEIKKAELLSVQQFAVPVTLDPDTAHPALLLSDDGKQVHCGDVCKKFRNNRKRFDRCVNVLGNQSFSSGRFYYEVQVKGKTEWDLGVAKESIDRKGSITVSPEDGFWTIWLRKGYKYEAIDEPSVRLSLKSRPEKVGVFVDYDEGLIRFYDVDTADRLYSFTGCSFTEKLLPFFSPCSDKGGTNSAPLIITPVIHDK